MSFRLEFTDIRKCSVLMKACECIVAFSDTALLKTNDKGMFIAVTDPDSLSCAEVRFIPKELVCDGEFAAKILLTSFLSLLKSVRKSKMCIHGKAGTVYVSADSNTSTVESTRHRARVYHVMSKRTFMGKNNDNYLCIHIPSQEFQRIVTRQIITAGRNGGISEIRVVGHGGRHQADDNSNATTTTHIQFITYSNLGFYGGYCKMDLFAHANSTSMSSIVDVQHAPSEDVLCRYFISYLRKPYKLFEGDSGEHVWLISNNGMLLESKQRDDVSVHMYFTNVTTEQAEMLL